MVSDSGIVPLSVMPRRIPNSGAVSRPQIATAARSQRHGCADTCRPQRCHAVSRAPADVTGAPVPRTERTSCTWRRVRRPTIRRPAKPSSAGSSVSASATMTSTVSPDISPIVVTIGMPAIAKPQMAITTVMPAKVTAAPEVAMARPAASSTERPANRCSRWRVTMNSA